MQSLAATVITTPVDFYNMDELLTPEEREIRTRVRTFMQIEVEPIINDYWDRAEFPKQLIPKLALLGLTGGQIKGYGCPGLSPGGRGRAAGELARGGGRGRAGLVCS